MDISLTTGAMTKIATRSYQKFISSVWTNYLIQHWASLEIWMTRTELMDRYTLILTWLRVLMASFFLKVTKPYEIIWPTVPISTGRLQLSSGQCLTTIFSIFIKVTKPYEIIWPTGPISTGRLQLSSGQCLTTIFSIFIKVRKITSKSQSLKSNLWKLQDKKGGIDNKWRQKKKTAPQAKIHNVMQNFQSPTSKHSNVERQKGDPSKLMSNSVRSNSSQIKLHQDNENAELELQLQEVTSPSVPPGFKAAAAAAAAFHSNSRSTDYCRGSH